MDIGTWYFLISMLTSPEFIFFWFTFSVCVEILQIFMLWWLADKINGLKKDEERKNVSDNGEASD